MSVGDQPDRSDADLLKAYLAERDVACPCCGYNLRNLTSSRCPECGDRLCMRVTPVEPRMAAYITLLAACCAGFGGSTLFGLLALTAAPASWWAKPTAVILIVQWCLSAVITPIVLSKRRRFRRAARRLQWLLGIVAWVVFLALSTAVVLLFDD